MNQEAFVIEREYEAGPEKIWEAITDENQMNQWYFKIPGFVPKPGHEFSFTGTDLEGKEWIHLCRITEVEPLKKLSHTWSYKGYPGESLVTWELFPNGNLTRVKLTHSGLDSFPKLKSLDKNNFAMGWTEILGTLLKNFVEADKIKPVEA